MQAIASAATNGVFTVAVLGSESTGKTQLVQALAHIANRLGHPCQTVSEHLRTWVDTHQRTPQAHEQQGIAAAQVQAAQQAYAALHARTERDTTRLLLLDTTAVMTAAYSAYYFADHSLWDMAFTAAPTPQLVLLMGLDLPWHADGLQRDSQAAQRGVDHLLRNALQQHGVTFQVVYGQGAQRTDAAWQTIANACTPHRKSAFKRHVSDPTNGSAPNFHAWGCEGCSDPDCERRLFKGLL